MINFKIILLLRFRNPWLSNFYVSFRQKCYSEEIDSLHSINFNWKFLNNNLGYHTIYRLSHQIEEIKWYTCTMVRQ